MTKITELFSAEALQENVDGGFIRVQTHPEFPELAILNYTELAQFSHQWNDVTRVCRGLIYNTETLEVLARPFPKIHNWNEPDAPRIIEDAPVFDWSDKADGSLGILYPLPNGNVAVATRGSFASEQAVHATEILHNRFFMSDVYYMMTHGWTPLTEIIYPENRIVLDYGDLDTLLPLGYIRINTGEYTPDSLHPTKSFHDLMGDLSRENKEGWVAWLSPYKAVKIKQPDYVELHRIVTGLNKKSVWRALRDNTLDELIEQVPDELYDWVEETREEIQDVFDKLLAESLRWLEKCGGFEGDQKTFALRVNSEVPRIVRGWVFGLRAGKDVDESIWRVIEPKGNER